MSNIGGTYDLADKLPNNREFGHFFGRKSVSSPSGVRSKPSISPNGNGLNNQWGPNSQSLNCNLCDKENEATLIP